MIKHVIKLKLPFFFISMNYIYGPYLGRYALLCGESFNIYSWVSGFLSNFRFVSSWYSLIFNISKRNQYKLRYKDKKLLSSYYGLNSFLKLGRRKTKKDMFIPVSYYNSNKFQNNLKFYLKNETRNIKKKFNMVKFNKY